MPGRLCELLVRWYVALLLPEQTQLYWSSSEPRWDKNVMYTQRVIPHRFVSGHGSFLYWMRPNGEGPYLVMTPVTECPLFEPSTHERNFAPAKLEYLRNSWRF